MLHFFLCSHIIGNNKMCPSKVLNESKRTNKTKKKNNKHSIHLLFFFLLDSRFVFFCNFCANDWLIVSSACWIWFDGSLLVVLFSHLMCHSLYALFFCVSKLWANNVGLISAATFSFTFSRSDSVFSTLPNSSFRTLSLFPSLPLAFSPSLYLSLSCSYSLSHSLSHSAWALYKWHKQIIKDWFSANLMWKCTQCYMNALTPNNIRF